MRRIMFSLVLLSCIAFGQFPSDRDKYGGLLTGNVTAEATGVFHTKNVNGRWMFYTPLGNPYFFFGVDVLVVYTSWGGEDETGCNAYCWALKKYAPEFGPVDGMYGDILNRYFYYSRQRIIDWGFTGVGMYSFSEPSRYVYHGNMPQLYIPHVVETDFSKYALGYTDGPVSVPRQTKNVYASTGTGGWFPDPYDPTFAPNCAGNAAGLSGYSSESVVGFFIGESDELSGVSKNHPHLGFTVAASSKTVIRDPGQYGGPPYNYTDPKNYAKYALKDFLVGKYTNIAAMNTAWGTAYTTFDSANDSTGFLDERGSHLLNWDRTVGTNASPAQYDSNHPAIYNDLDQFAGMMVGQFFKSVVDAMHAVTPIPTISNNLDRFTNDYWAVGMAIGGIDIMEVEASDFSDRAYMLTKKPAIHHIPFMSADKDSPNDVSGVVTSVDVTDACRPVIHCATCDFWEGDGAFDATAFGREVQFTTALTGGWSSALIMRYAAFPDHQTVVFEPADWNWCSGNTPAMSQVKPGDRFWRVNNMNPDFSNGGTLMSQESRGAAFQKSVTEAFDRKAPNGERYFIGYDWWSYHDYSMDGYANENYNLGLVTWRDNAYDGVQASNLGGFDKWGFPVGNEHKKFGDLLSLVKLANSSVFRSLSVETLSGSTQFYGVKRMRGLASFSSVLSPTTGQVIGTVTDAATSFPLGASVQVSSSSTTDQNGSYNIIRIAPGSVQVVATAPGYYAQTSTVAVIAGQATTANFALVKIPPQPPTVTLTTPNSSDPLNYQIQFSASGIGGASITGVSLNFGDGSQLYQTTSKTFTITHRYNTGVYTITATATDTHNLSTTVTNPSVWIGTQVFSYKTGFGSSGLALVGSAVNNVTNIGLVNNVQNSAGAVWYPTPINPKGFKMYFKASTVGVGDGFAFVLQGSGTSAIDSTPGNYGYVGIRPSVAIRFITHDGTGVVRKIGLMVNGTLIEDQVPTLWNSSPLVWDDGIVHYFFVTYNGTFLTIGVDDAWGTGWAVNLPSLLGSSAYVGITGSTSSVVSTQSVTQWEFSQY